MLLDGKRALVTGASRGIGRASAIALAREGAKVALNFAGDVSAAEDVKAEIASFGGESVLVQADVSDAAAAERMVETVAERLGGIDILVNNAGIIRDALLIRMKEEDWEDVIRTNLSGVFHCTKAAARLMIKNRYGRIVNISSVVGVSGNAGQANYAAAKAGIIGFSKAAAKEFAGRGVTVNVVAPGFIETDMTATLSDRAKESMLSEIPARRMGKPDDVASAVLFLASDLSSYITGQVLMVNGGMVM